MTFKTGDFVGWTAYPSGIAKVLEGKVVEVLPAGYVPEKSKYPSLYSRGTVGGQRSHTSYVVQANGKYYWPVVSKLQLIGKPQVQAAAQGTPKPQKKSPQKTTSLIDQIIPSAVQEKPEPRIVNYIGFSLDHSGSMQGVTRQAMRDFNENIGIMRDKNSELDQDTFITVNKCGVASNKNEFSLVGVRVEQVSDLTRYEASGNTPLYDSIGDLIDNMKSSRQHEEGDNVSYLIMVITDGEENASRTWGAYSLKKEIERLQASGNWSFVFRVPYGQKDRIVYNLGVPSANVIEWDGRTESSLAKTTKVQTQSLDGYYNMRAVGQTQSQSFFATMSADDATIKSSLQDLTNEVWLWPVTQEAQIRDFVEQHIPSYTKGKAFYQLTKSEEVQGYKDLIIQSKVDGKIYGGDDARALLNLPQTVGTIRVRPGQTGNYDVFIKSTSVNRKLLPNTRLLYLK